MHPSLPSSQEPPRTSAGTTARAPRCHCSQQEQQQLLCPVPAVALLAWPSRRHGCLQGGPEPQGRCGLSDFCVGSTRKDSTTCGYLQIHQGGENLNVSALLYFL